MSTYFPLGNSSFTASIAYAVTATTGSYPIGTTSTAVTASWAASVAQAPSNGKDGAGKNADSCSVSIPPTGPTGPTGLTGPSGSNSVTCPPGTIECSSLNAQLSVFNVSRSVGNQFNIVCIQTQGYVYSSIVCPDQLPSSSIKSGGFFVYPVLL